VELFEVLVERLVRLVRVVLETVRLEVLEEQARQAVQLCLCLQQV
jgi:hypothetical protein|tara:strand:+ start:249 stop:383 length:135 start_codon:yes stop_codon:yes gene_type:complete